MEKLKEIIQQAIGHASMCWENVGKAGVFDSTEALKVGDQLLKDIEAELNRWIPVGERLPEKEDNSILVTYSNGAVEMTHIEDFLLSVTYRANRKYPYPTHWQPLPLPPKEDK